MAADITYHRLKYSSVLWVALAFGIFVVVGFYSARMTNDYPSYDQGRGKDRLATRLKVDKAENAQLYPVDKDGNPTATWVDQDKGLISIPIDEAMTHELPDLKNVTVGEGAVIPGSTPAPAPAPAPAATNAAPAAATPSASTNAAPVPPATATKGNTVTPTSPPKPKHKKPASTTAPTPPTHP
ncbi:MAG TPA: hypothetical protein VHY09_07365 [Candidatus Methylacidiphilales bacterium]|jgi:hypothetical protein|nr:hypothetical protein [Candidatus Methylacidiphilales bacterium]